MLRRQVLVQVSGEDLRRNYDDPMLAIIEAFVTRATEIQRKAKGKKEFYKVDLTIFGMDQAAIIERRHPGSFPIASLVPVLRWESVGTLLDPRGHASVTFG